ncbi:MAG: universal stress protein [Candidatus Cyclobacteriaceae bacterium M3_2C_046]
MGKVLVALDGHYSFTQDLITAVSELCRNWQNNLYMGLLVKDLSYSANVSNYFEKAGFVDINPYNPEELLSEEDQKKAELIANFVKTARDNSIRYEIFNDFKLTAHEVVKQTTYADLLIVGYQIFYNSITGKPDNSLLYQVLKGSKCPVLIIPNNLRSIDNIIFTYDGKESSVFAIKSFSHLFSKATQDKITSILTVTPSLDEEIKNEKFLLELVKQHYKNVGVQLLEGTHISQEIINFADSVENPLVIMGAYGRSTVSNLILPSVAKGIIEKRSIPLFIAHR